MNTIFADKLFEDKNFINSINIEPENKLTLDFSRVNEFNLNNLFSLLNLQKLALINNAKLDIKNTTPTVEKILFETGIYKTLSGFAKNQVLSEKRLSFS